VPALDAHFPSVVAQLPLYLPGKRCPTKYQPGTAKYTLHSQSV